PATINGIGITQTASVTVTAGPAAEIAVNAGNNQSATVGTAVATPPAVIVHDASGNPVAGLAVTFHVASGSGTADPTTPVTTNGSGIAALTSWTLGPTAGTNTLTATAAGSGISGNPVTFTADGTAGAAGRVAFTTAPSGTAQNGVALAQQPVLQLEDANGNPVSQSGVVVTTTVSPAGATPSNATATTNGSGVASFTGLSLTGTVGSYTLSAGTAAVIGANSLTTQSAPAGSAVSSPPSVIVHDGSGNPVQGVTVTFAAAAGSGSVTGGTQTTNESGIATVGSWTLSTTAGTNTLTATSSGLTGSPVTFTAEGTAGAAGRVAFTPAPTSAAQSRVAMAQQPVRQL